VAAFTGRTNYDIFDRGIRQLAGDDAGNDERSCRQTCSGADFFAIRRSRYNTCKVCHEDIFNSLQKTRNWDNVLKTKDGAEAHSCETCHGPGAEHVNSGGDKSKIFNFKEATPKDITKHCLECTVLAQII
jgi:hypothetical protein